MQTDARVETYTFPLDAARGQQQHRPICTMRIQVCSHYLKRRNNAVEQSHVGAAARPSLRTRRLLLMHQPEAAALAIYPPHVIRLSS